MRNSSVRRLAAAVLVASALTAAAVVARAGEGPEVSDGPKTVVKYVTCASGLAFAPAPHVAIAAFLYCAKTFLEAVGP